MLMSQMIMSNWHVDLSEKKTWVMLIEKRTKQCLKFAPFSRKFLFTRFSLTWWRHFCLILTFLFDDSAITWKYLSLFFQRQTCSQRQRFDWIAWPPSRSDPANRANLYEILGSNGLLNAELFAGRSECSSYVFLTESRVIYIDDINTQNKFDWKKCLKNYRAKTPKGFRWGGRLSQGGLLTRWHQPFDPDAPWPRFVTLCQRPERPPGFGHPSKFHAKRGWLRPKAQTGPQTCWILNEISKMAGGCPGLRPRWPSLQTGWIVCEIFNSITPNLVFVFFFFVFVFLFLCEQIDAIVVFWRFSTILLKTSLKIQHAWGLGHPFFAWNLGGGAPEAGWAVEACNTGCLCSGSDVFLVVSFPQVHARVSSEFYTCACGHHASGWSNALTLGHIPQTESEPIWVLFRMKNWWRSPETGVRWLPTRVCKAILRELSGSGDMNTQELTEDAERALGNRCCDVPANTSALMGLLVPAAGKMASQKLALTKSPRGLKLRQHAR